MASQAQPRRQVVSLEHWASNISTAERYTSQTKSDFGAPAMLPARKDASQQKQGAATIVLGYEPTTSYATESKDQYTSKLSSPPGSPAKAGGSSSPFGAKDCIHNSLHRTADDASPFDTEHNRFGWAAGGHAAHRAGLAAIELCRSTSLQLNQTRIVLGDTPPEYQTTTESALTGAMAALAASGEALAVPRRRPVAEAPIPPQTGAAAPALVPGRLVEIGSGGPPEPSSYETTYGAAWAVPVDVSSTAQQQKQQQQQRDCCCCHVCAARSCPPPRTLFLQGARGPACDPGRGSLVLGHEQTEYVSEAMRARGQAVFKLGEHTVPALAPRFVKGHPALAAARAAAAAPRT